MNRSVTHALVLSFLVLASTLFAQPTPRRPRGVYTVVNVVDETNTLQQANPSITPSQMDAGFNSFYQDLLSNPAIAGLALRPDWATLNANPPGTANAYYWNLVDDAFDQVAAWNTQNSTQAPKTIQLIVIPGFNSPPWLLNQIPSCDGLFQTPSVTPPGACGKATFTGFSESSGSSVLPLPWNPVYKNGWQTFVTALAARYASNPAFVSIAVTGPTATSAEMNLPNDGNSNNPQTQFGTPITPDNMWIQLQTFHYPAQPAYQKTNQAFIDEWNNAIDMFGQIFSGITLVATTGNGFPNFTGAAFTIPPAFAADCANNPNLACAAATTILQYFMQPTVGGANAKATQDSGFAAARVTNNLGVPGVKQLSQMTAQLTPPSAQVLGGSQLSTTFSIATLTEGCTSIFPPNSVATHPCQMHHPTELHDQQLCPGRLHPAGLPGSRRDSGESRRLQDSGKCPQLGFDFAGTGALQPAEYLFRWNGSRRIVRRNSGRRAAQLSANLSAGYSIRRVLNVDAPAQVVQNDRSSVLLSAQELLDLASPKLLRASEKLGGDPASRSGDYLRQHRADVEHHRRDRTWRVDLDLRDQYRQRLSKLDRELSDVACWSERGY